MIRRVLFGFGALLWGGAAFLLGLYVTFPAEVARERVVYEFGEWSKHEYALDIGDLSLWRLSGLSLDEVTFYTVKKGRRTKDNPEPEKERTPLVSFDALSVRASPLGLVTGKRAAAFVAEIYGGAIDGTFAQSDAAVELAFDAEDVDLGKLPVETEQMSLKLLGLLSGEADLTFDQTDTKKSAGFLRLGFDGLGLGAESSVAGFTLPEVVFSKAAVAFEIKEGKLEVTEGAFEGETLDAELSGDIVLNKKLLRSRNRMELAFSLPEDLDKLAQLAPDLKRSRDDEGKYHMSIGGTILSPTARFARAGAKRAGRDEDGPIGLADGPRIGAAGDREDMSDEERREARRKRIEERRARLRERREQAERNNPINEDGPPPREFEGGEEFEPGMEDGPMRDGPRNFPPDGPPDGPMDGPPDGPPPMDEGPPPDFEQEP